MAEQNSKRKYNALYRSIDEILWHDWDPIGVNDNDGARSEYQSYTPEIVSLKISGVDRDTIARKLNNIMVDRMGLPHNLVHCRKIADKILDIQL